MAPVKKLGRGKEKKLIKETCVFVVQDGKTGQVLEIREVGPNIITNAGDQYYAQRGAAGTVTYTFSTGQMVVAKSYAVAAAKTCTFGKLVLQTFGGAGAQTYYGRQDFASGYPKVNDDDVNNTGAGTDIVTYKTVYTTSQANGTIKAVAVCRDGGSTNSSGQLLNFKTLTAAQTIVKTSSVTLTVFVNHTFNGV